MTTPNDTPTPDEVNDANYYGSLVGSAKIDMLVNFARHLKRELAEAKAQLEGTERARAFAMENAAKAIEETLVLSSDLKDAKQQRDAARAEAAKWRECAEGFWDRSGDPSLVSSRFKSARELYDQLCPSPPQSSPPSSALPAFCNRCSASLETQRIVIGSFQYCSIKCAELDPRSYGPPSPPTATAPSAAAPTPAASRLQALESAQDILRRRTEFLLEQFCKSLALEPDECKTEWPADLALPTLTSTSPPTQKPERGGGDGSK